MNKKILLPMFLFLGIGLVLAGVVSYLYSQEMALHGNQVNIVGDAYQEIDCEIGFECSGSEVSIENDLSGNVLMSLSFENDEGVESKYVSELTLTKKDTETWETIDDTITIGYTLVGDEFHVTGVSEGYTAVYYKDAVTELEDRLASPQAFIPIDEVIGNLPYVDDGNNLEETNYCQDPDNYKTCRGAKIWVIPDEAVLEENGIDWALMSEFYYETELIQYNSNGVILVYPEQNLVVTPVVVIDAGEPAGNYTSTANIGRLA